MLNYHREPGHEVFRAYGADGCAVKVRDDGAVVMVAWADVGPGTLGESCVICLTADQARMLGERIQGREASAEESEE